MKSSCASALVVLLLCIPILAAPQPLHYKVTAAGGTTWTTVGDPIQLTLWPTRIKAVDSACPPIIRPYNQYGAVHADWRCPPHPTIALWFHPAEIIDLEAGATAHYVSITWQMKNGHKKVLIFKVPPKHYPAIVSFFEAATGKKAIDADAQIGNRPLLNVGTFDGSRSGAPHQEFRNSEAYLTSGFTKVCPAVQIAHPGQKANFTVALDVVASNTGSFDNESNTIDSVTFGGSLSPSESATAPAGNPVTKITIYNQDRQQIGVSRAGSVEYAAMGACTLITKEWGRHHK